MVDGVETIRFQDLGDEASRLAATVPAAVESGIWSLSQFVRGDVLHAIVSNLPHNFPGCDVKLATKIQEYKTIAADTKNVASAVQRGARQIVRNTVGELQGMAKEVVAVMPTGTGSSRIAQAREALTNTKIAQGVGTEVHLGLPGAGRALKLLAPVGAVMSGLEFADDVRRGEVRQAVGSGTAAVAGGVETVALAGPLVGGGLASLPPVAAVIAAFSMGWSLGTAINDHVINPLVWQH